MSTQTKPRHGARESNAGDEFHILWAARRAIQLLNPHSKLHKLFIEKVSSYDENITNQDYFLGADVAEYYEGVSLLNASKVIVYQLKYSTRHPSKAWTASRLCDSSDKVSVIERLCQLFEGFLKDNSREQVLKKLKISLVSNQPADMELLAALSKAQQVLSNWDQTTPIETRKLRNSLADNEQKIIHKLQDNSGLSSTNFTDFLQVLTFEDCNDGSRQIQRQKLINELGPLITNNPTAKLRELCELIRKEAQPESSTSLGLSEQDVLAALGVYHKDNIFPSPSRLQAPKYFIDTEDLEEIVKTTSPASKNKIIVHGNAGSGKTTIIQNTSKKLPSGSVVIIYDCFGGGDYRTPGEQRHTQDRAFLQLTNDLAVHCGTPFLLETPKQIADLQRNFRKSIEKAAEIVRCESNALLLIIIDAADNAVIAAQEDQSCFIQILWNIPLPDNCRLLMTCRSHRRNSLEPPADVAEYELKGFDRQSSSEHLRNFFPNSNDEDCLQFHSKTGGNPRMQHYLLEAAQRELVDGDWNQFFAQSRFSTLEEMFIDLWESSVSYSCQPNLKEKLLAGLMCLTRPIPIKVLAEVHNISLDEAINFCHSLEPGLTIESEYIGFRDEDFESFLQGKLKKTDLVAAHNRIASRFLQQASNDEYAAKYVAEHLFQADLDKELIKLVVDDSELSILKDEILRLQIRYRRISLGLQSTIKINSKVDTIKLTMIAAELARSNSTVKTVVLENPDLAALYGDAKKVIDIYLSSEQANSYGVHLQAAAVLSRNPVYYQRATDHLKFFSARSRLRRSLPEEERINWHISVKDIACQAEAIFWMHGAEAACKSLKRWRPIEAIFAAVSYLAKSLATQLETEQLENQIKELKLSTPVLVIFLAGMWSQGKKPSQELIQSTANRLENFLKSQKKISVGDDNSRDKNDWAITFCEMLVNTGVSLNQINAIIELSCPQVLSSLLYDYMDLGSIDNLAIRAACLSSVLNTHPISSKELLPKRYTEDQKNLSYEEKSNVKRCEGIVSGLIDIYQPRAQAISGKITFEELATSITSKANNYSKIANERDFKYNQLYQLWACKTYEALLCFSDDATVVLNEIANTAESNIRGGSPWLWTKLAKLALQRKNYYPIAYQLLERAAQYVMVNTFPAKERLEILLTCSSIISLYDEEIGREYYKRALVAANGIDDENLRLLSLNFHLTKQIQPNSLIERRSLAVRLISLTEAHQGYVSDNSEIPWQEAINTVTRLNLPDGLALCSRWDDENILELDKGIIPLIQATISTNFLSPLENLWMLRLVGREYNFSKIAIVLFDQLKEGGRSKIPQLAQTVKTITDWILKDLTLQLKKQAATTIVNWAKENKMSHLEGIKDLQELLTFVEQPQTERKEDESIYEREVEKNLNFEKLLNEARKGVFDDLDKTIDELWQKGCRSKQIQEFVKVLGNCVLPFKRVEFLEEMVCLASNRIYLNYFLIDSLVFFFNEWKGFNYVCENVVNVISKLLDFGLPALTDYSYNLAENLELLLSLSSLTDRSKSSLLIPAVSKHIDYISPQSFYIIVKILLEDLSKDDCKEILEWSILRTEKHFAKENKKIPDLCIKNLPEKTSESIALFFWTLLGHPDKRIRWRVAHTVRGILKQSANKELIDELIDELIKLLTSESASSFLSEKSDFYWMSARSWLLMLFLRLADEMPKNMLKYANIFAEQALDKNFPHAQIREFARLTVLRMLKEFPSSLPEDLIEKLHLTNQPLTCFYPPEPYYKRTNTNSPNNTSNKSTKFSFDSIDTLPYWMNPIANIFAIPSRKFVSFADQWITEKWHYSNCDCQQDYRRIKTDHNWELSSNRHGSIPVIESLGRYLEYHAIFCSAGQLIDTGYSISTERDDPEDTWQYWLRDHLSASNNCWLSDICSPTPLSPEFWGIWPDIDEWLQKYPEIDYDAALGLVQLNHLGEIVIAGNSSYGDSNRRSSTSITSALVEPDKAKSLLYVLQFIENPYKFSLYANTDIDELGFKLQPSYEYKNIKKGLDQFDSLSWESQLTLPQDFLKFFDLKSVNGGTKFLLPDGSIAAKLEIWENDSKQKRIAPFYSEGKRLWINIEVLLKYLCFCEKDLILQVHITRNRDNSYSNKEHKYDFGKSTVYILRQNGNLETLGKSCGIRETDSPRTSIGR